MPSSTTPLPDFPPRFTVGPWSADPSVDEVSQGGRAVKLEPRTMRLLLALAQARGEVVSTDRLFDAVWPGLVVTLSSLYEAVAQLRKVLGAGAIATVPRKGYRLTLPVQATQEPAPPASASAAVPKLGPRSIAVLPFRLRNVPDDHAFLRESLAEDLIAELSRQPSLAVVARGTMLSYVGAHVNALDVCRELGARHGVEGLLEVRGDTLHITVQIVDGTTGTQASADAVDLALAAWPHTGSLVVSRLARALNFELLDQAARHAAPEAAESLSALTLATRAWIELFARTESKDSNELALGLAQQALALEPRLPQASTCLAFCHWRAAQFGWMPGDPAGLLKQAAAHAERAIDFGPREPDAYYVSGLVAYSLRETARAEEALRHCLRLSPSHAPAYGLLALVRTRRGHPEEAAALCERAFALSPREPLRVVWHLAQAWAALALGDHALALEASQRAMAVNPDFATAYVTGAAAAQKLGDTRLAATWVDFLQTRTAFNSLKALRQRLPPATEAAHVQQMVEVSELLRQAGLPPG